MTDQTKTQTETPDSILLQLADANLQSGLSTMCLHAAVKDTMRIGGCLVACCTMWMLGSYMLAMSRFWGYACFGSACFFMLICIVSTISRQRWMKKSFKSYEKHHYSIINICAEMMKTNPATAHLYQQLMDSHKHN